MNRQKEIRAVIRRARSDPAWPAPTKKATDDDGDLAAVAIAVFVILVPLAIAGLVVWPKLVVDAWGLSWAVLPLIPAPYVFAVGVPWAAIRRHRWVGNNFSRALGVNRVGGLLLCGPYAEIWRETPRLARNREVREQCELLREMCESGSLEALHRAALHAYHAEGKDRLQEHLRRTYRLARSIADVRRLENLKIEADKRALARAKAEQAAAEREAARGALAISVQALGPLAPAADAAAADLEIQAAGLHAELDALDEGQASHHH